VRGVCCAERGFEFVDVSRGDDETGIAGRDHVGCVPGHRRDDRDAMRHGVLQLGRDRDGGHGDGLERDDLEVGTRVDRGHLAGRDRGAERDVRRPSACGEVLEGVERDPVAHEGEGQIGDVSAASRRADDGIEPLVGAHGPRVHDVGAGRLVDGAVDDGVGPTPVVADRRALGVGTALDQQPGGTGRDGHDTSSSTVQDPERPQED
jgi:hypothetical protein